MISATELIAEMRDATVAAAHCAQEIDTVGQAAPVSAQSALDVLSSTAALRIRLDAVQRRWFLLADKAATVRSHAMQGHTYAALEHGHSQHRSNGIENIDKSPRQSGHETSPGASTAGLNDSYDGQKHDTVLLAAHAAGEAVSGRAHAERARRALSNIERAAFGILGVAHSDPIDSSSTNTQSNTTHGAGASHHVPLSQGVKRSASRSPSKQSPGSLLTSRDVFDGTGMTAPVAGGNTSTTGHASPARVLPPPRPELFSGLRIGAPPQYTDAASTAHSAAVRRGSLPRQTAHTTAPPPALSSATSALVSSALRHSPRRDLLHVVERVGPPPSNPRAVGLDHGGSPYFSSASPLPHQSSPPQHRDTCDLSHGDAAAAGAVAHDRRTSYAAALPVRESPNPMSDGRRVCDGSKTAAVAVTTKSALPDLASSPDQQILSWATEYDGSPTHPTQGDIASPRVARTTDPAELVATELARLLLMAAQEWQSPTRS